LASSAPSSFGTTAQLDAFGTAFCDSGNAVVCCCLHRLFGSTLKDRAAVSAPVTESPEAHLAS
jgi:hypothetical protein